MISLPVLENTPHRPSFAQGPRSLSSVRLLRISVTDRCNLRCVYCMPDDGMEWQSLPDGALTPAEIQFVAQTMMQPFEDGTPGATHLKITGGEPTVRRDVVEIAERLSDLGPTDLSLTTNATQLHRLAKPLKRAGVDRLTISLDSLRSDRFETITRGGRLDVVKRGIEAALEAGFTKLKFNVVVINGWNDDEVVDFARLTLDQPHTVRFIEYMPLGDSKFTLDGIDPADVWLDNDIVRERIGAALSPTGALEPIRREGEPGVGPAELWRIPGAKGKLGFISAMSAPFCETCNRLRLTSLGELRSCLFDGGEVDLIPALRPTPSKDRLIELFHTCVALKPEVHSSRGNRAMSQLGG